MVIVSMEFTKTDDEAVQLSPWFSLAPIAETTDGPIAVVGAGVAGSAIAGALIRRGRSVVLIDRDHTLSGAASGNPLAGVTPRLSARPSLYGRFQARAYLHAVEAYDRLTRDGHAVWRGARGAFLGARDAADEARMAAIAAAFEWPESDMVLLDAAAAATRTGVDVPWGGLWFDRGGSVAPAAVCRALGGGAARLTAAVAAIEELPGGGYRLVDGGGATVLEAAVVVIAGGPASGELLRDLAPPLIPNRGQLSLLPAGPLSAALKSAISFGAYLSPAVVRTAAGPRHMLGASYGRLDEAADDDWSTFRAEDHAEYLSALAVYAPDLSREFAEAAPVGRASLRATTPDQLPICGPVPDVPAYRRDYADIRHGRPVESHAPATYRRGLYVLGGLGSRGFQTGPLAAEVLADQMTGQPSALPASLLAAIHPGRFLIRALKRGRG